MKNIFCLNDWPFHKFTIMFFSIQVTFLGLIFLDYLDLHIPLLRQVVGFFYLSFIPGFLILRIMKLHNKNEIQTILYALGLSISILMFIIFFMNTIYPYLGMKNPLSFNNFLITLSLLVLFLYIISYIRDKEFEGDVLNLNLGMFTPITYFLILLPFLSIIGARLVSEYQNNIILLLLIPIISLIPIAISFNKIPNKLYPLALFSISIALIYHSALVSNYIWGWDVNTEYYLAGMVIKNSIWNYQFGNNANAMLSVTSLAPVYYLMLNIQLDWVFKIIFPLFYCFLPLGLFEIYKKQTNDKIAFFACFFFISYSFFYFNAVTGGRQEIAELFLCLFLLVLLNENKSWQNSVLLIVFISSLAVSHYGTSYLWILIFSGTLLGIKLISYVKNEKNEGELLDINILLFFFTFALGWYIFLSNASNLETIVKIIDQIAGSIFDYFLLPEYSQGLEIITSSQYSFVTTLEKYVQILFQLFITFGFFYIVKNRKQSKFSSMYIILAFLNFSILIAGIIVPYFASQLNTSRLYHMAMIILAPFMVVGAIQISRLINIFNINYNPLKITAVLLTIFLLFNTAWIYGVFNENPSSIRSIALYQDKIDSGPDFGKNNFYAAYTVDRDIYCVEWLANNKYVNFSIYADLAKRSTLFARNGIFNSGVFRAQAVNKSGYFFLSYSNTRFGLVYDSNEYGNFWNLNNITYKLEEKNLIYENGGAKIFLGE